MYKYNIHTYIYMLYVIYYTSTIYLSLYIHRHYILTIYIFIFNKNINYTTPYDTINKNILFFELWMPQF